ncbi:MAG: RDD family protein [Acidobacteriota bacterium]
MKDETVLGIDNIALELPIAGLGSRSLAVTIDYFLMTVINVALIFLLIFVGDELFDGGWIVALMALVGFLVHWGYFAVSEIVFGGQTLGKKALRLRVVTRQGGRPGIWALLIRNFIRVVDLIVGVPLIAFDPLARRLGDRLGGTLVVHGREPGHEVVLGRTPATWGSREVALAESFLRRSDELDRAQSILLARRLLRLVERDEPELLAGANLEDPLEALRQALDVRER